jgi:hypothetical protein
LTGDDRRTGPLPSARGGDLATMALAAGGGPGAHRRDEAPKVSWPGAHSGPSCGCAEGTASNRRDAAKRRPARCQKVDSNGADSQ